MQSPNWGHQLIEQAEDAVQLDSEVLTRSARLQNAMLGSAGGESPMQPPVSASYQSASLYGTGQLRTLKAETVVTEISIAAKIRVSRDWI